MGPSTALALYLVFVVALLWRTRQVAAGTSPALWLPFIWLLVVGSRPISSWFGIEQPTQADDYLEGSPVDRALFLALIACGCLVLSQRRVDWKQLWNNNRWLLLFFIYLGISSLWSEYTFVSFKRWIKDCGNLLMVLIILTDPQPARAFHTVLLRSALVLLPASVMLIKYFPELGRYYDRWTGRSFSCGVTMNKNLLGMSLFVFVTWALWTLVESIVDERRFQSAAKSKSPRQQGRVVESFFADPRTARRWLRPPQRKWEHRIIIGLMMILCAWMLLKADSSTALLCSLLGGSVIVAMKLRFVRRRLRHLGLYVVAGAVALAALEAAFDLRRVAVSLLGRDLTLTGRTEIWLTVLAEDTNPLFGVGFYSFWLGDRPERMSKGYHYLLNQAHNGYLETYLNNGWVGILLLLSLMLAGFHQAKRLAFIGSPLGTLRLALILGALAYAATEAVFNRLSSIWFCMIWASTSYATSTAGMTKREPVDLRNVFARHLTTPK